MQRVLSHHRNFAEYLAELVIKEKRAALAALRRGLGRAPGTASEMYPHVVRWLPSNPKAVQDDAFYIVASLFALHPVSRSDETSYGRSLAETAVARKAAAAVERRFMALLNAHSDDVHHHLRHTVALLRATATPVDWGRLLGDLMKWNRPNRQVQRAWARDFWKTVESGPAPDERS